METMVSRMAHLAMLDVTPEEEQALEQDLQQMIAFAGQLQDWPKDGVSDADEADEGEATRTDLRDDTVVAPFEQGVLLQNAPTAKEGFITV